MQQDILQNIVAAGLADRCEIQIYAIGVAQPTSTLINTFGKAKSQMINYLISLMISLILLLMA